MVKKIKGFITKSLDKAKEVAKRIKEKIVKNKKVIKKVAIGVIISVGIGLAINLAMPEQTVFADNSYTVSTISQTTNEGIKIEEAVKEDGFFDKIKNFITDKKDEAVENMKEKAEAKSEALLNEKMNWFQKKIIRFTSSAVEAVFNLTAGTLIKLPVELVANVSIMSLYMKVLVFSCALMAIIIVFQHLKVLLNNDEHSESIILVVWNTLKSVIYMFGFGSLFPKAIMLINTLTDAVMSIGYDQLGFNMIINFMTGDAVSIVGIVITVASLIALLFFLIIVFFTSCIRYWDLCELFIKAPIAFSTGASSKTRFYFYTWFDNLKQVVLSQLFYALHLVIFTSIMSSIGTTGGGLIGMMLLIGGIFKLMTIPRGLKDMLSRSHDEEKAAGFLKKAAKFTGKLGG